MEVAVVGSGYVGLVSGTCLAEKGNRVVCVDIDAEKVATLQRGGVPIYEPDLEPLFQRNIRAGRLHFTTCLAEAVREARVVVLALPTPPGADGAADLSQVLGVAEELGGYITDYKVVVDKSTVPVGTAARVRQAIARCAQADFDVVSNPEFLREGFAVSDFMQPDRILIGTTSSRAAALMRQLYEPYVKAPEQCIPMDEESAELAKYAANAFLATKITFMNELANYAERIGADIDKVRLALGADERIGKHFLFSGIGFGGGCFPKDVRALLQSGAQIGFDFAILNAVEGVNDRQRIVLFDKLSQHFEGQLSGLKIALWGLAFKPNTDDVREAPALCIIEKLLEAGAQVSAYDPAAMKNVKKRLGDAIAYSDEQYAALRDADALLIATEWPVFTEPDFAKVKRLMKRPLVFDGRNVYGPHEMERQGFTYYSVGRKAVLS